MTRLLDQDTLGLAFQVSSYLLDANYISVFLLTAQILQISKVKRVGHLLLLILLLVKIIVVFWKCHLFICVALLTIITLLLVDYLNLRLGWCSALSSRWAYFNRSGQFLLFSRISLVAGLSAKLRLVLLLLRLWLLSIALIWFDVISTDWVRPICPVEQNLMLLMLMVDWLGIAAVSSTWWLLLGCLVFDRVVVGILLLLKLLMMHLLSRY